jgi:hypothetical protein
MVNAEPLDIQTCWVPIMDVALNGRGPFRFIIDTAYAGPSVADRVAADLGLPKDDEGFVQLDSFAFADQRLRDVEIYASDDALASELLGTPVDGIIGMGLLRHYQTTLDYRLATVEFTPIASRIGRRTVPTPGFGYVRTKYIANYLIVPVTVEGRGPYDFILDTGMQGANVSEPVAETLGLSMGPSRKSRTGAGPRRVRDSRVQEMAVGPLGVSDLKVQVMEEAERTRYTGATVDGILGYAFLKDLRVTFSPIELFLGVAN